MARTQGTELDHVVARNLREVVEGRELRHVDVAMYATAVGLHWTANTVAQVLTLRRGLSLLEVPLVAAALGVPVGRLLEGDDAITLPSGGTVPLESLRDALTSKRAGKSPVTHQPLKSTEDESKLASRLGITVARLQTIAGQMFGRTVTEERDSRVGDLTALPKRVAQAKRGHAMREVASEIEARIASRK
ncbi:MAG TPA: hypothetical protein VGL75_06875 [Acidothermaceae bacterium]|jgi:hypothetical protein